MAHSETGPPPVVDFSNIEIAFSHKSDSELRQMAWLFRMMNKQWLVKAGSTVGLIVNKIGFGIFNPIIKATIFKQFCGGTSLEKSEKAIQQLYDHKTHSVLDYGAESKHTEHDFDITLEEYKKAVDFASVHPGVDIISMKVTALATTTILENWKAEKPYADKEQDEFERVRQRLHTLCEYASAKGVAIFIDAEDSWYQDAIDHLVLEMMSTYNKGNVVVYQTYQLYRKDKLEGLKSDHLQARSNGYILGAKIVRGAYMEKERKRAAEMGYPSPIQDTKEDSDRDFNAAIRYCVDHHEEIASCNASHNQQSNLLFAQWISEKGIPRDHPHVQFCQLYGMSDYITFNLAKAGYNVSKYLVYGPVKEVIPYLIRRAQENSSVTGEMSRELSLIDAEMHRRGLK